jgi:hypothetical protein
MARNPISMSDTAFDSIYSKIEKSYPNACILFIDEIKNEELEEVYNKHKSTIIKEHSEKCIKNLIVKPNEVLKTPTELQVFHGTHSENIDYIVNDGFDPSKNKVSAYGIGSYFATTARYSFNYMKSADTHGISYMFVVNIFIGKMKYNKSLDEGDAYVDNINNPSIFCMPLKEQALPKYLVAFHKNAR